MEIAFSRMTSLKDLSIDNSCKKTLGTYSMFINIVVYLEFKYI